MIVRAGSTPQQAGDKVAIGFSSGRLTLLNANAGSLIWQRTIALPKGVSALDQMVDIDADPLISRGVVYAATYQGRIAAINVSKGKLLWKHDISTFTGFVLGPKWLYVTDATGHVWAFDRRTGTVEWRQNKLKGRLITAPALQDDYVVVGDNYGYLYWMAANDGHLVASTMVDKKGLIAPPVVSGNSLLTLTPGGDLYSYKVAVR